MILITGYVADNEHDEAAFVAAEIAYRYDRDHVTSDERPQAERHRLATIWRRLTHHTA